MHRTPRTPQRISLSISQKAYSIIEYDMQVFQNGENLEGFINTIILNYKDASNASISLAKERERDKYANWIQTVTGSSKISTEDSACLDRLVKGFADNLKTKMNSFENGIPLKPRIKNGFYDALKMGGSEFKEAEFYPREGKYIKAILEEYARLPFIERERIYYKKIIDTISIALGLGQALKFEYTNGKQQMSQKEVRPYKITSSSFLPYNYLLALPINAKKLEDMIPYRISRISEKSIELSSLNKTSRFSREEKNTIEQHIKKKGGIQYLPSDDLEVTLALSEEGYDLYKSILHLRPEYIGKPKHKDKKWIMTFICAKEQIKNYFFQFGEKAEIISPDELRQEFAEHYRAASEIYKEDI